MIVIANVFPKLQTLKELVSLFPIRHSFRTPFDSHHVKGTQTLMKSA